MTGQIHGRRIDGASARPGVGRRSARPGVGRRMRARLQRFGYTSRYINGIVAGQILIHFEIPCVRACVRECVRGGEDASIGCTCFK